LDKAKPLDIPCPGTSCILCWPSTIYMGLKSGLQSLFTFCPCDLIFCIIQHFVTCLMATIFTGISLFSLLSVFIWFISEQITYANHNSMFLQVHTQRTHKLQLIMIGKLCQLRFLAECYSMKEKYLRALKSRWSIWKAWIFPQRELPNNGGGLPLSRQGMTTDISSAATVYQIYSNSVFSFWKHIHQPKTWLIHA